MIKKRLPKSKSKIILAPEKFDTSDQVLRAIARKLRELEELKLELHCLAAKKKLMNEDLRHLIINLEELDKNF